MLTQVEKLEFLHGNLIDRSYIMKFCWSFSLHFLFLVALFLCINARLKKKKKKGVICKKSFQIDFEENRFLKDGKPFLIISGDMHYFRIPRCYWMDRFAKMKHAGLNTVTT